jgi:hypothetical protein
VQLQPSGPNELGSALAGVATARAALSVIAALNTTFVINNGSLVRLDGTWFYWLWRGQKAAMLTPTKNPA